MNIQEAASHFAKTGEFRPLKEVIERRVEVAMEAVTNRVENTTMKELPTFTATIWAGLKEGYNGPIHSIEEVEAICQEFTDMRQIGLTVTPTRFIYMRGNEPGVSIGFINYPHFPTEPQAIRELAFDLGYILMVSLHQERLTVVCTNKTYILERR